MILADKIIALRKKSGWSQEELADMLDVSRQSVSKWEGAQATPDMARIVKMSELFGVSTDVLLKDDLQVPDIPATAAIAIEPPSATRVSLEEASAYVAEKAIVAPRIAVAAAMIIVSPVVLIVFSALAETTARFPMSETAAVGVGLIVLMVLVAIAVGILVSTNSHLEKYRYIEEQPIDTAYGVDGMARERQESLRSSHTRAMVIGVTLCILAVIPIFVVMVFASDDDIYGVCAVAAMLALVATGVYVLARSGIVWGSYQALLEEGDYTRAEKAKSGRIGKVAAVYWLAVVALFLAYSFATNGWNDSWVIWPVAGVVFAIVMIVANALADRKR